MHNHSSMACMLTISGFRVDPCVLLHDHTDYKALLREMVPVATPSCVCRGDGHTSMAYSTDVFESSPHSRLFLMWTMAPDNRNQSY